MKQQEKTTITAKKKKRARKGLGCRGQGLRWDWDPRCRARGPEKVLLRRVCGGRS